MKLTLLVLFCMAPFLGYSQSKLIQMEYWFDNNYSGKTSTSITPACQFHFSDQISTGNLASGLHTFHYRVKNDSGYFSSEITRFVIVVSSTSAGASAIDKYEYWFDNDYSSKVTKNI